MYFKAACVEPRWPAGHELDPTIQQSHLLQKIVTSKLYIYIQSPKCARDCMHALPRKEGEGRRSRLRSRPGGLERAGDSGPSRPSVRGEDAPGAAAPAAPQVALLLLPAPRRVTPSSCTRGSEITAPLKPPMPADCPLLRVGVRLRTCAAGEDGIWSAGQAICTVEKGCGRCSDSGMCACGHTSPNEFLARHVALGDVSMASGMVIAMVPKAPLSLGLSARKKKYNRQHNPLRACA